MIFSENRFPPQIESGAGFFGIMLYDRPLPAFAGTSCAGDGKSRAAATFTKP